MKNKITQQQLAFYKLWSSFKENREKYVSVWEFVGEIHIKEINKWELMSYTCPHRVYELFDDNPGLIERRMTKGRTGARYYQYRFAPNPSMEKIKDESILEFYKRIKRAESNLKDNQ